MSTLREYVVTAGVIGFLILVGGTFITTPSPQPGEIQAKLIASAFFLALWFFVFLTAMAVMGRIDRRSE